MSEFSRYLINARAAVGKSQPQVVRNLNDRGLRVSQGLLAQYEGGKIALPDRTILKALAELYGRSYSEMVILMAFDLLRDKYGLKNSAQSGLDKSYTAFLKAFVGKINDQAETPEMKKHQLRASAALFRTTSILDVEGNSEWQKDFPNLEQFWVIVPNFIELTDSKVRRAVIENLKKGVKYFYFVAEEDLEPPLGRLHVLKESLPDLDTGINKRMISEQIVGVPLEKNALIWLPADMVVANPHRPDEAEGFLIIRKRGTPVFSIKMERSDLRRLVDDLGRYMAGKVGAGHVYG